LRLEDARELRQSVRRARNRAASLRPGAVLLGKTNMDEFAMGSSNETSYYGPVHNPWDLQRVPGGSSGGSAAAVAARMAPAATGTDTGGSIRQPAALAGVSGLKPTYGVVSRYGMVAFASSLDQGGPLAKGAADLALLMNAMAGFDARDSTSLDRPAEDYARELNRSLAGLRIGLPREYFGDGVDADSLARVREAIAWFESQGAKAVEITLANTKMAVPCITCSRWPKLPRTSPGSMARAMAIVRAIRRTCSTCTAARAPKGSAPRSSAGS
jgi:aspartyl-tRNA(Asn)/glutamyl-tRNA(Gln) amidotransferase subunit A